MTDRFCKDFASAKDACIHIFTETEPTYCAFPNSIAIILIIMTDRFCKDFASAKDACIHI